MRYYLKVYSGHTWNQAMQEKQFSYNYALNGYFAHSYEAQISHKIKPELSGFIISMLFSILFC